MPNQPTFHKEGQPAVPPKQEPKEKAPQAPAAKAETGPVLKRVIIATGENGDNGNIQVPEPGTNGLKWLTLPRNTPIEIDERVIAKLKKKFVIKREWDEKTMITKEIKQYVYPIHNA